MTVFLTKKQKKLMRERKRKKKLAESGNLENKDASVAQAPSPSTEQTRPNKRPRPSHETLAASISTFKPPAPVNNIVTIPKDLSTQEAKKFRKDARRKARAEGRDDSKLEFAVEGSHQSENPSSKKRKKDFPRINELVKEEKAKAEKEKILSSRAEAEAQLSEEIKGRYVAIDCEMVGIGSEGRKSVLARVSITNWKGEVLMDSFVKVPTRVTDFRTHVSGVTSKLIKGSDALDPADCREQVAAIIKGKIVVGHALKNDFDALMLHHPKDLIRDTSKYRPFQRFGGNKWRPRKLRDLVKEHVGLIIQQQGESHDSVDDARATMELFKSVRDSWERELEVKAKKGK